MNSSYWAVRTSEGIMRLADLSTFNLDTSEGDVVQMSADLRRSVRLPPLHRSGWRLGWFPPSLVETLRLQQQDLEILVTWEPSLTPQRLTLAGDVGVRADYLLRIFLVPASPLARVEDRAFLLIDNDTGVGSVLFGHRPPMDILWDEFTHEEEACIEGVALLSCNEDDQQTLVWSAGMSHRLAGRLVDARRLAHKTTNVMADTPTAQQG